MRDELYTWCHRFLVCMLFRHSVILFRNLLVFTYYVVVRRWNEGSVLQSGDGLASVDALWLPKMMHDTTGYVPKAMQGILSETRHLSSGVCRAQDSVHFPELRPDVMVIGTKGCRWRSVRKAHRPKLTMPDQSLLDFLAMKSLSRPC